jgi:ribosomal-protein-alanine N-acetyltransferase
MTVLARVKPRVDISQLTAADGAEFVAAARASKHLHAPWVAPPLTLADYRAKLQRTQAPVNYGFGIRRLDSGALVGYVGVTNVVRGNFLSAYLGYYAFAGHERQGLMTEGLTLVARHAFGALGLHRLEANIQPDNGPSLALVRSCGFAKEGYSPRYLKIGGRWRDHERWALLAR